MSIKASLDLGTNTALLLVGDFDEAGRRWTKVFSDESYYVRLGQGLAETRRFHPEAKQRLFKALDRMLLTLADHDLDAGKVLAVATASARDSLDSEDLFREIKTRYGLVFRTLTGEQEAQGAFYGGLFSDSAAESSVVVDLGGGSTECQMVGAGVSFSIGSVKLTEMYFKNNPVTDAEIWEAQEYLDGLFSDKYLLFKKSRPLNWIGVAGTITTLAQVHLGLEKFDAHAIHGTELTRGDIHRFLSDFKMRTADERKLMRGMDPNRADVILAGSLILWRLMETFDVRSIRVSTRGLRYGLIMVPGLFREQCVN